MLKNRQLLNRIKSRKNAKFDKKEQITNDICFLFEVCNQDVKLIKQTGKLFGANSTKRWETVSFTLDLREFSCTATRYDYWFRSACDHKYVHERRHLVKWGYKNEEHTIGSYDLGPLVSTLGENRPKRAGIIFDRIANKYNQSKQR